MKIMDRRKFIKVGAGAVTVGAVSGGFALMRASERSAEIGPYAGSVGSGSLEGLSGERTYSSESGKAGKDDLLVRFLGTGAADWDGVDERGELRRLSSVLLDNRILIDFTPTDTDMLPEGFVAPDAVFYTHSHSDHYNPKSAIGTLNAKVVYVGDTWLERAKADFAAASSELGKPSPEVVGIPVGRKVRCGDIAITSLPQRVPSAQPSYCLS